MLQVKAIPRQPLPMQSFLHSWRAVVQVQVDRNFSAGVLMRVWGPPAEPGTGAVALAQAVAGSAAGVNGAGAPSLQATSGRSSIMRPTPKMILRIVLSFLT